MSLLRCLRFLPVPALLLAACGGGAPPDQGPGEVRTVVLVTIDTWRWDANGFLGDPAASPTPFLDQFAGLGLVATDAVAPVPLTGPSHWSILTGRWPWRDGMRDNGDAAPPEHGPTVAGVLGAAGWQTAAFVSAGVLDHSLGFAAGFDHFDDRVRVSAGGIDEITWAVRRGDATVAAAGEWIAEQDAGGKLFLWVHLFDPHFPYDPPTGPLPGEHGAYRAEVAFADAQVHALTAILEAAGRLQGESLYVVISDHGEGLGEHGEATHGFLLHRATTRIPLLIVGPGIEARRYEPLVTTADVAPTILGYLGLEAPAGDGIDLLRTAAAGSRAGSRSVPLESLAGFRAFDLAPATGLRHQQWLWEASPEDHLWNLRDDPGEANDLAATHGDTLRELRQLRAAFAIPEPTAAGPIDGALRRDLEALGYLSAGITAERKNVRSFIETDWQLNARVLSLAQRGEFRQAEEYARQFLERNPRSPGMWIEAGFIAAQLNDLAAAEERFRRAIELDDSAKARLNLGNVLLIGRRPQEAEAEYRRVLEINPEDPYGLYNLGLVLGRQQRHAEAEEFWQRFLERWPDHPKAAEVRITLRHWSSPS